MLRVVLVAAVIGVSLAGTMMENCISVRTEMAPDSWCQSNCQAAGTTALFHPACDPADSNRICLCKPLPPPVATCRPCLTGEPGCTEPESVTQQFCDTHCIQSQYGGECSQAKCYCAACLDGATVKPHGQSICREGQMMKCFFQKWIPHGLCAAEFELGTFSDFGPCTASCGTGYQVRTRPILKASVEQNSQAPLTEEWQVCNTQPCPQSAVPAQQAEQSRTLLTPEQTVKQIRGYDVPVQQTAIPQNQR